MRLSFSYRQSTISYLRFGTGNRYLICFHGFGDRSAIWYNLGKKLDEEFTFIAIDLPFHGDTKWQDKTMQAIDFEQIVNKLMKMENIDRFSLAGFSFGARIVENLLFSHTNFIDNILLFAPDGFGTKGLKYATTLPVFLRRMLQFLLKKPDKIVLFTSWLYKKQLVNKSVHWFFSENIGNPHHKERLFCYWLSLNDFEIKPSLFKKKLQETQMPTHVFLGIDDEITPLSIGTFLTEDTPTVQVHLINSGHQILKNLPKFKI